MQECYKRDISIYWQCTRRRLSTYLTHETSLTVLVDNELQRLIEETVAAITMPAGTRTLVSCNRLLVIETNYKIG